MNQWKKRPKNLKNKLNKGFTLLEVLLVLIILAIVAGLVISIINPLEQLNRAKDRRNSVNATTLLEAVERFQAVKKSSPEILNSANSLLCTEIIDADSVYDFTDLRSEVSDWFSRAITEEGSGLFIGINNKDGVKVCYQVKSVVNVRKANDLGCQVNSSHYLCLPE